MRVLTLLFAAIACAAEGGAGAEKDTGEEGNDGGEAKHPRVGADVQRHRQAARGKQGEQSATSGVGEQDAESRPETRKQQALRQ